MKKTFLLFLLALSTVSIFAQPTGFPTPIVWLKADDPGKPGNQAAETSLQKDEAFLNFNPSFIFKGGDDSFELIYDRSKQSSQLTFVTVYYTGGIATEQNVWAVIGDQTSQLSTKMVSKPGQTAAYFGGDLNSPVINAVRQSFGETGQSGTEGKIIIGGTIEG